jgi:hypothetical protein
MPSRTRWRPSSRTRPTRRSETRDRRPQDRPGLRQAQALEDRDERWARRDEPAVGARRSRLTVIPRFSSPSGQLLEYSGRRDVHQVDERSAIAPDEPPFAHEGDLPQARRFLPRRGFRACTRTGPDRVRLGKAPAAELQRLAARRVIFQPEVPPGEIARRVKTFPLARRKIGMTTGAAIPGDRLVVQGHPRSKKGSDLA